MFALVLFEYDSRSSDGVKIAIYTIDGMVH